MIKDKSNGTQLLPFSVTVTAPQPSVNNVSPPTAILGLPTNFTVTGSNFVSGMVWYLDGCGNGSLQINTPTSASFTCTPGPFNTSATGVGVQSGTIKDKSNGTQLLPFSVTVTAPQPSVLSVSPLTARLDVVQNFVITGTGLTSNMVFTLEGCEPESGTGNIPEIGIGSSSTRTYRCIPRLPGPKHLSFQNTPGGIVMPLELFSATETIDHPPRLGNPAARGVPAEKDVSLWNGNVHLSTVDMTVPGKGLNFVLSHSYNSYDSSYEFGRGSVSNSAPWRINWDLKLGYVGTSTTQLWVQREDGAGESFFKDTDNQWYPIDQGNFNILRSDIPSTGLTTAYSGEREH